MDVPHPEIERPKFEMRLNNDSVRMFKGLMERAKGLELEPAFLELTASLPPTIFECDAEDRVMAATVAYTLNKQDMTSDRLAQLVKISDGANVTVGRSERRGWVGRECEASTAELFTFWRDGSNKRAWTDAFLQEAEKL